MSLDVGTLVGYLKLDTTDVGKQVRKAQDDVRRGLGDLDRDADKAGAKVGSSFGASLSRGMKTAAVALGGLFVADKVVAWFRGAVDAASDANETINKSTVIFGRNETAMEAWAKSAVRNLGMTQAGALDAASGFGDMFSQLGFGADQAAAMSRQIVQMAADFGSFNNLGTEDVLERVAAGFRGEYDSLQKLIPNISAARVEQEALAMTGKKSAAQLTAQEKAAATLAIVQKDGARAMGDFARTADGAANTQKQTAAAAHELAVKVGNMLLPAYTALVRFGRDQLIPFLSGTADIVGDAAGAIGMLVGAFRDLPGPMQGALLGMAAFVLFKDRFTAFGAAVQSGMRTAGSTVQSFGEAVRFAGMASEKAGGGLAGLAAGARTFTGSAGLMKGAASGLLGVLGGPWGLAFTAAVAAVGGFAQAQANARKAAEDLSRTLDEQTGAVTKATREMALKKLLDDFSAEDWRKVGDEAGMSIERVVSAITGSSDELATFRRDFDTIQASMMASGDPEISGRWQALGNAIASGARDMDGARLIAEQTRKGMTGFSGTTDAATESVKVQTDAINELRGAQQRLAGNYKGVMEATADYEAAVDGLTDSIKQNGKTLDLGSEKGRDNQAALFKLRDATIEAAEASLKHGEGIESVAKTMEARRAAFVEQATKLTGNKKAAEELAEKLGLTRAKVDELSTAIAATPDGKAVKIVVDDEDARARIAGFKALLNTVQSKRVAIDAATGWSGQRHGSIMQFAHGGFRGAGIYSDGADVVRFAERGTGGEAYIPLGLSNRARSTRILAETNRLMGNPLGAQAPTSVNVAPPNVQVFIGNEEVTGRIRVVVRDEVSAQAREYALGVV